jgi:HPt (histidine-containing phosphotransfer) domain-containing protein
MSSEPAIDPQALQALRNVTPGDDSFLREIVGLFLADTPKRLVEIEASLARGDAQSLTLEAHSVKGSSGHFGANRLRALSEEIEQLGRAGNLAEVAPLLPELKLEYARVQAALEPLL